MVEKPKTDKNGGGADNVEEDYSAILGRRRSSRRMGDQTSGGKSMWLISFTDVMALMLTFFVLLFAMSNPKEEEWDKFTHNIQENFNRFHGQVLNRGKEDAVNIDKVNFSQALDLNYLKVLMGNLIRDEKSLEGVRLVDAAGRLIISLPHHLLFDSGAANIKEQAHDALFTIGGALRRIKNRIEIVGHADPRPLSGSKFSSNWELSLSRAASVAAGLESFGYESPISIKGQGSGRFDDIPDSFSVAERLDLSRRVDIVIMADDGRRTRLFDIGLP